MSAAERIRQEMAALESAEEFFDYFGIAFDDHLVRVNRLHILQRFHQYLEQAGEVPADTDQARAWYARHLARAHEDFIHSTPGRERVFAVFRRAGESVEVPVASLLATREVSVP